MTFALNTVICNLIFITCYCSLIFRTGEATIFFDFLSKKLRTFLFLCNSLENIFSLDVSFYFPSIRLCKTYTTLKLYILPMLCRPSKNPIIKASKLIDHFKDNVGVKIKAGSNLKFFYWYRSQSRE